VSPTEPTPIDPTPTDPWRTAPPDAIDSAAPPRSDRRRVLLVVAIAVLGVAAAGATGVALARGGGTGAEVSLAASSSTPTPSGDPGERHRHTFGRPIPGHLFGGPGGALHGEFVVRDGSGGYRTMLTQRGTATKVSDSSITVRSEDGFTATYAVTATTRVGATRDGVGSIEVGADVVVMAEQKGEAATALAVADLDSWGRPGLRLGQREEMGTGYGA
jgi:hypothetical protein